jgi:biotin carboxylase
VKTLLIIGAGREQVAAYQCAKRLGVRVLATDQNPHAPAVALADGFGKCSTADLEGNLRFARERRIDGVLTLCSETAVPVVAAIACALGLPGLSEQTAYLATNKNAMRAALNEHNVLVPEWRAIASADEAMDFIRSAALPVVIKPSDASGQKATVLLKDLARLDACVAEAKSHARDGKAIIERFVPGSEINVTAVVFAGKPMFTSFSNRETAAAPHFGIAIRHVAPADVPAAGLREIERVARASIAAIGMRDGIAYPQIIFDGERAWLVEIAARIPGGFMREVALYQSGIDLVEVAVRQALGMPCDIASMQSIAPSPAVAVDFITCLDVADVMGKISRVEGLAEARQQQGVQSVFFGLEAGCRIPELDSSGARFGAVIATGCDRAEACWRAAQAKSLIQFIAEE